MKVQVFDENGTCVSSHYFRDPSYDGAGKATTNALWRAFSAEYELTSGGATPYLAVRVKEDGVYSEATEYAVSILPPEFGDVMPDNRHHWELRVEYRGGDLWAVMANVRMCLGKDGTWDWELRERECEDEWLAEHRFDLSTALLLAKKHAPDVTVNGHTAREVLARYEEKKAKGERS